MSRANLYNGTDFKNTTEKAWRRSVEKLLKGKSFETLYSTSEEHLQVKPIYFETDQQNFFLKGMPKNWSVAQTLFCDNKDFNARARDVLKLGQKSLNINLNTSSQLDRRHPRTEHSIQLDEYSDFIKLFSKIDLTEVELFFNASNTAHKIFPWCLKWCYEKNSDPVALNISLGGDPVSTALIYSGFSEPWTDTLEKLNEILKSADQYPSVDVLTIRTDIIHNSGGHKIQQLVYALGLITAYVDQLAEQGIDPAKVLSSIRVKMAIGNDQFLEIAKLRAMRLLWDNICAAFDARDIPLKIDAVTSWRWLASRDLYNNMLRATGQAFSAIAGGCNSLDILPFDLAVKIPDEFSLRQSRNLHIILAEEAHMNKITDAGAGSYFLDALTVEMAQKSWQGFQSMEKKGGLLKSIISSHFQTEVNANAQKQESAIKEGSYKMIGVNCYLAAEKDKEKSKDNYYHQKKLFDGIEPLLLKRII